MSIQNRELGIEMEKIENQGLTFCNCCNVEQFEKIYYMLYDSLRCAPFWCVHMCININRKIGGGATALNLISLKYRIKKRMKKICDCKYI